MNPCGRIFNLNWKKRFVNRILICFFKGISNDGINIMIGWVVNGVVFGASITSPVI